MAESFFDFDRSAYVLGKLHEVRGSGLGELCGWRSWEITSRATIKVTPQQAVRVKRLIIPANRAADWLIHNIGVVTSDGAQRSSFVAGQALPGAMFSPQEVDNTLDIGPVATAMTIEITLEYIGDNPAGDPFYGALLCSPIDGQGLVTLPVNSGQTRIVSATRAGELGSGKRIAIQIDDRAWVFRQNRTTTPFELVIDESPLRREQPSMESLLYIETDNGNGTVMRSGDPQPVGPKGVQRPATVPFRAPAVASVPDQHRLEVPDLWAVRPRVLSLHVIESPLRVLFGLDESTNQVVFEIALDPVDGRNGSLFGRFNKDGYTPDWWDAARPWNADGIAGVAVGEP